MKRKILLVSVIAIMTITGVFAAVKWINDNKTDITVEVKDDDEQRLDVKIIPPDDDQIWFVTVVDDGDYSFDFKWSEDFTKCTRIKYSKVLRRDKPPIREHATDISDKIITEPTCENNGQKYYVAKFDDGQTVSSGLVNIPALGHSKVNFDTATCEKEGTKGQRCTRCNKEFDVKSSEATGKYTPGDFEITKEPTCTEPGSKQQVCNVCGEILKKETIPAKGHDYDNWQEIEGEESCIRKCKTCSFEETCEHEDSITTEWNAVNDEQCVCSMFCTKCGKVLEEGLPENHVWMPSRDTSDFFECENCHIKRRFTESDK